MVSGPTGSGKSTIADEIARELGATVARQPVRDSWEALAARYGATFTVVECMCSDIGIVRARVEHRTRSIPDWYELTWERVAASHRNYEPLTGAKIVVDAIAPLADNLELVRAHLRPA